MEPSPAKRPRGSGTSSIRSGATSASLHTAPATPTPQSRHQSAGSGPTRRTPGNLFPRLPFRDQSTLSGPVESTPSSLVRTTPSSYGRTTASDHSERAPSSLVGTTSPSRGRTTAPGRGDKAPSRFDQSPSLLRKKRVPIYSSGRDEPSDPPSQWCYTNKHSAVKYWMDGRRVFNHSWVDWDMCRTPTGIKLDFAQYRNCNPKSFQSYVYEYGIPATEPGPREPGDRIRYQYWFVCKICWDIDRSSRQRRYPPRWRVVPYSQAKRHLDHEHWIPVQYEEEDDDDDDDDQDFQDDNNSEDGHGNPRVESHRFRDRDEDGHKKPTGREFQGSRIKYEHLDHDSAADDQTARSSSHASEGGQKKERGSSDKSFHCDGSGIKVQMAEAGQLTVEVEKGKLNFGQ